MFRWHERHCRNPNVDASSGIPYCSYCFALANKGDAAAPNSRLPQFNANLAWPPVVWYIDELQSTDQRPAEPTLAVDQDTLPRPLAWNHIGPPPLETSGQIRLLRLNAGKTDDPLHGDLDVVSLLQPGPNTRTPDYEALSYTWGGDTRDTTRFQPLYVGKYWDIVYITANCTAALENLRDPASKRTLWVDCVCIDFYNEEERAQQASIAGSIYARARQVISYLGEPSDTSAVALRWIRGYTENGSKPSATLPLPPERKHCCSLDEKGLQTENCWAGSCSMCLAVKALLERTYFRRVWVVLEFVLAQTVVLQSGRDSAVWPMEGLGADVLGVQKWMAYRERRGRLSEQDLVTLLADTATCDCADPRDRIFVLLGMVSSWTGGNRVVPCHRLSVEEVFIGIAAYLARNCNALSSVLAMACSTEPSSGSASTLPTWVPDWRVIAPSPDPLLLPHFPNDISKRTVRAVEPGLASSTWRFLPNTLKVPNICSRTGSLRISATVLCTLAEQAFSVHAEPKNYRNKDGNNKTSFLLEHTWNRSSRFIARWLLPEEGQQCRAKPGDKLVWISGHWLSGQFVILRPATTHEGHYRLIQVLSDVAIFSIPYSFLVVNGGSEWEDETHDAVAERHPQSMFFGARAGPHSSRHAHNFIDVAIRRMEPMSVGSQLRVIALESALDADDSTGAAITADASLPADVLQERFIEARNRLLDMALFIRIDEFRPDAPQWRDFCAVRDGFISHNEAATQFLARPETVFEAQLLLAGAALPEDVPSCVLERVGPWELSEYLRELDLVPSEDKALVEAVLDWFGAWGWLLSNLAKQKEELDQIWRKGSVFPGSDLPEKWAALWRGRMERLTEAVNGLEDASRDDVAKFTVLFVLREIMRVAKVASFVLPDFDGFGWGGLDSVMAKRARILGRVGRWKWGQDAFHLADISGLAEFDYGMLVRMELRAFGFEVDVEELVTIL